MMILSFAELGIKPEDYQGMTYGAACREIINIAADKINAIPLWHNHAVTSIESMYDWAKSSVCFTRQNIMLYPTKFDDFIAINS